MLLGSNQKHQHLFSNSFTWWNEYDDNDHAVGGDDNDHAVGGDDIDVVVNNEYDDDVDNNFTTQF